MTVSNSSNKSCTLVAQSIGYFRNCSSRKLIRMFSLLFIMVLIAFWTWFLHSCTRDNTLSFRSTSATFPSRSQEVFFNPNLEATITDSTALVHSFMNHQNGIFPITSGHNKSEIQALVDGVNLPPEKFADITAVLHYKSSPGIEEIKKIRNQINSILAQTIQPKQIWIIASSTNKFLIEKELGMFPRSEMFQIKTLPHVERKRDTMFAVADAPWLLHALEISTDFIWILEPGAEISSGYLAYTFGLMKTEEYKSTLVGFDASLLPSTTSSSRITQCIKKTEKSHPVDMIHGSWLLRTSWVDILRQDALTDTVANLPLAYFISSSLLYRAHVPSVVVPSPLHLLKINHSCQNNALMDIVLNSVYPNTLDQAIMDQQDTRHIVTLILDGPQNAIALLPLVCKLFQTHHVHIILANGLNSLEFEDAISRTQCTNRRPYIVHDLSSAYNNDVIKTTNKAFRSTSNYISCIDKLMDLIRSEVLIHVKDPDSYFYHAVRAMTQVKDITSIGLPKADIEHALWIADLPVQALRHWNNIKIDLVLITDRRPQSLSRLLTSTNNAYYFGDDNIEIAIHMEQSANIETRTLVQTFDFKHGHKKVRHRIRKGGLMPAIVESWYPSHNDNYGVLLEDDIELSPLFYSWSKYTILKYRYSGHEDAYKHVYGVSLYSPRNLELLPEGRRPFNPEPVLKQGGFSERAPYATQIPCSWGAVYFPEHWLEFHTYLTERLEKENKYTGNYYNITVPGSRSERWKKSWKKYLIQLVYLRGYVMVYPNFQDFESFSTNHLEFGTHVKQKHNGRTQHKLEQFLVPLMHRDTILTQLPGQKLPEFERLPFMDLWGRIRSLSEIGEVGERWHQKVSACSQKAIGAFDPSDILCPFDENVTKSSKKKEAPKK